MVRWRKKNTLNSRGSVLLEGVGGIVIVSISLLFLLEADRLTKMHISIEQAAFLYVRERVYGRTNQEAENLAKNFLKAYWGGNFSYPLDFEGGHQRGAWYGKIHVRYPQFFSFKLGRTWKHHLEVTKICRFPG